MVGCRRHRCLGGTHGLRCGHGRNIGIAARNGSNDSASILTSGVAGVGVPSPWWARASSANGTCRRAIYLQVCEAGNRSITIEVSTRDTIIWPSVFRAHSVSMVIPPAGWKRPRHATFRIDAPGCCRFTVPPILVVAFGGGFVLCCLPLRSSPCRFGTEKAQRFQGLGRLAQR
jgi:hypothetical protein